MEEDEKEEAGSGDVPGEDANEVEQATPSSKEEQAVAALDTIDELTLERLQLDGFDDYEIIGAAESVDGVVQNWQYEYDTLMMEGEYFALDKATGVSTGSSDSQLAQVAQQPYTGAVT